LFSSSTLLLDEKLFRRIGGKNEIFGFAADASA
jgi:hypothetical protein